MQPFTTARLHESIAAVCPIEGVKGEQGSIVIDYGSTATVPQRTAALAAVAAFNYSDAATDAWMEDRRPERKAIRQAATQAVADNDTYLAIATPSNAQVAAQVRRLTQQNNRIIPRLIQVD